MYANPQNKKSAKNYNNRFDKKPYQDYQSKFFHTLPDGHTMRLSTPLYGARTGGTKSSRTEFSEKKAWPLSHGTHIMRMTMTIKKVIPGVHFHMAQIFRGDPRVKYVSKKGRSCPTHMMMEYNVDTEEIDIRRVLADCSSYRKIIVPGKYPAGEEFTWSISVIDGIMYFDSSKGAHIVIGDYNFLPYEYEGRGDAGKFKTGVYLAKKAGEACGGKPK